MHLLQGFVEPLQLTPGAKFRKIEWIDAQIEGEIKMDKTKNSEGGNYRQAGLPAELAKEVVQLIRAHPELGFRSLSEFARHAIIDKLRTVKAGLALDDLHKLSGFDLKTLVNLLEKSESGFTIGQSVFQQQTPATE